MRDDENLVTVASFTTLAQAEPARLLLMEQGVTCFLADAEAVTMTWLFSNAVGGVKLQVPQSEAEHATQILAKHKGLRSRHADDYGLDTRPPLTSLHANDEGLEDEEPIEEPGEADRIVNRASVAAVIGLLICPPLLHLYSLWLLLQLPMMVSKVSPSKRPLLIGTVLIDSLVVLGAVAVLRIYFP